MILSGIINPTSSYTRAPDGGTFSHSPLLNPPDHYVKAFAHDGHNLAENNNAITEESFYAEEAERGILNDYRFGFENTSVGKDSSGNETDIPAFKASDQGRSAIGSG